MKKIVFIWFLKAVVTTTTCAQNNLPPAYEIKTDTAINITLDDAYWQMLEDSAGEFTIDQVRQSPLAERFHSNSTKKGGIDYSIKAYWARFRFKNSMKHEARITIPKNVTYADLHILGRDQKWIHKTTGAGVPGANVMTLNASQRSPMLYRPERNYWYMNGIILTMTLTCPLYLR